MVKQRTDKKFKNKIIQYMKKTFSTDSSKYKEVLERGRIEKQLLKKDGTPSLQKDFWYPCENCGKEFKKSKSVTITKKDGTTKKKSIQQVQVDHKDPIFPPGADRHAMSLDEILERIDCPIENLWRLCLECHSTKTKLEEEAR